MKPSVGRIVHYQSYGTPGGEYKSTCRAAIVTAVPKPIYLVDAMDPRVPVVVDLCVLNPEGLFFNEDVPQNEDSKAGGTWHWPERVED